MKQIMPLLSNGIICLEIEMNLENTRNSVLGLLENYGLNHPNLKTIEFREAADKLVVFTTEGHISVGAEQIIRVPENVLNFDESFIIHLFAHEIIHIWQKSVEPLVLDKNEREFQAYYNGVFPYWFDDLPACPEHLHQNFAKQALRYFGMMNDVLKSKYQNQAEEIETYCRNFT